MPTMHKLGRTATTITADDEGYMLVKYHDTKCVRWNDREIRLAHEGHMTRTVRIRMNQASNQFRLGYEVRQIQGEWFVVYAGDTVPFGTAADTVVVLDRQRGRKYAAATASEKD